MPLFARTQCLRRFSGCGLVPVAWQQHSTASVACASLSLRQSSLTLGHAVRRMRGFESRRPDLGRDQALS